MAKFETSIVIHRPAAAVFAFLVDSANYPKWSVSTTEAKQISTGPLKVGSTIWFAAKFLGRRFDGTLEVTEYEENRRLGLKTTSGPLPFTVRYILEPVDRDTRLDYTNEVKLTGVRKVLEPMIAAMGRRQLETSLENLKKLLESPAAV